VSFSSPLESRLREAKWGEELFSLLSLASSALCTSDDADDLMSALSATGVTYSFTLSAKSAHFTRTRWSRTFLVCTDLNGSLQSCFAPASLADASSRNNRTEYSVNAVNWLLKSLAEDNDEVVVLRVIEPGSSAHNAWKSSMEEARDEAEDVLEDLMQRNADEKSVCNLSNSAHAEE